MKFLFSFLFSLIFSLIPWVLFSFNLSGCEERSFTVTAYYSPLSGQVFYYKSWYIEEVILNWQWLTWAWWKKVFPGMLAAPATYDFGGIVYFPYLGIWEIADRGGAIVLSGERNNKSDRIDVWMWRWEEWLIRALIFGKQYLSWFYCPESIVRWKNVKSFIDFSKLAVFKNFFDMALWLEALEPGRRDIWVWYLQKYLNKFWFISQKSITWFFGPETKKALCNYQVSRWIVSRKSRDCWIFGPRTRFLMKHEVENKWYLPEDLFAPWTVDQIVADAKYKLGIQNNVPDKIISYKNFFYTSYKKWDYSQTIWVLQKFLISRNFFTGNVNSLYDKKTIDALCDFQISQKIVKSWDKACGYLGPNTRNWLNKNL